MKVLLDIKDSKADFVLELLNDLAFVKVKILTDKKTIQKKGLAKAIEQVNSHKQNKTKLKSARELLNKL